MIDQLTILEIKRERIAGAAGQGNFARELLALSRVVAALRQPPRLDALRFRLKAVNRDLRDIADAIRDEEAEGRFGPRFIALARAVYRANDHRAKLKREINCLLGEVLVDEKSYAAWTASARRSPFGSAARNDAA